VLEQQLITLPGKK